METLLNMVIWDKWVDSYKLFVGQEDLKRVYKDLLYDMDEIVVHLSKVECYIVTDLDIDSNGPRDGEAVINA